MPALRDYLRFACLAEIQSCRGSIRAGQNFEFKISVAVDMRDAGSRSRTPLSLSTQVSSILNSADGHSGSVSISCTQHIHSRARQPRRHPPCGMSGQESANSRDIGVASHPFEFAVRRRDNEYVRLY